MYHTYTTDAVVLQSESLGDAHRKLLLFTREFGLIYVRVQSVRGHLSKLRPLTQVFSRGVFTLVRGKYGWRLINVVGDENYFYETKGDETRLVLARAQILIRKFVGIDEAQQEIFDIFVKAMGMLPQSHNTEAHIIESLMTCRVLKLLGFLTDEGFPEEIISPYTDFSNDLILRTAPYKKRINSRINSALRESGLN